MKRYHLSGPAQRDLREIRNYIAADSVTAAICFVDLLKTKCQRLAEFPGMGREREELGAGLRSFAVSNYLIFYRERNEGIEIVRVLHGARDIDSLFP